jgi:Flp pilus assembly protein TadD
MTAIESEQNKDDNGHLVITALLGACFLIYGQVWWFEFINLDDNLYIYDNPFVRPGLNWTSVVWAFTTFHSANWHPLTWLSHMLDASIFGPRAGGHHFVNVLFHAANSVLAFYVFRKLTGDIWKAGLVALLFVVHPTHVESVAWVSERKDVLSTFFWLLTMLAYVRYVRALGDSSLTKRLISPAFGLVVLFFVLSLLSKPMGVTLPFVLLLCDYWPLERLKRVKELVPLVLEKLPLFALSAASAVITIQAQASWGAIQSTDGLPIDVRVLNAIVSYAKYVGMLVYPADLGVGYPYVIPLPWWQVAVSILLLVAVTAVCLWQRQKRKYLIFGWLWFLGTLVPVIGLVQVGEQALADRYTYVPYFGLFVMVVWGLAEIVERFRPKPLTTAIAVAIPILIFTVVAIRQASHWTNDIALYSHTLGIGQGNFITMHNYCAALINLNRLAEAETQCNRAIASRPQFVDSHLLLGVVQVKTGRTEEAIRTFNRALEIKPNDVTALHNLAVALTIAGRTDDAAATLDTIRKTSRQNLATPYANLAGAFASQKRFDRADECLRIALEFEPENADLLAGHALVLEHRGNRAEADASIQQALAKDPDRAEAHNALGLILMNRNDNERAKTAFEQALRLKPDLKVAKDSLDRINAGK